MGLAGRKIKQRIGTDPRNLTWADDASKFGSRYLQSLGWSSGTGLGASGEGRVSHLTVHQKLDLMGIGANRKSADEAAWKGGREYDGLLSRLNEIQTQNLRTTSEDNGVQPQDDPMDGVKEEFAEVEAKPSRKSKKESKKKRKRTIDDEDGDVDDKETKRRRKEEKKAHREERREKKEKKAAKKLRKEQTKFQAISSAIVVSSTSLRGEAEKTTDAKVKATATPIFRPHRARHLASKRLAAASAKSMNEILGISVSTVEEASATVLSSQSLSLIPENAGTSIRDGVLPGKKGDEEDGARLPAMGLGSTGSIFGGGLGFSRTKKEQPPKEKGSDENGLFHKSGMSVADYFAEKLRQKQGKADPVAAKADNNVEKQKKSKKVKV